ncbi:hypothetical protein [Azospirillum picis]|uniref:MobA/MobL protein domain-containing protein n=1 Tax=Azospirillum picis TaxID=488438 RepID=A0ABU0MSQ8_9PROT|nr:hypothetical protein [Azospirillum picis]MBP2302813.1 hypothetical protein [Azospirillum picis]MDQ0536525.1 hypothetical protein [Azospirillum picis]
MASKHFRHRHVSKSTDGWDKKVYDALRYDARGSEEVVAVWTGGGLPPAKAGDAREATRAWLDFAGRLRINARAMEEAHLGLDHDLSQAQNVAMVQAWVDRVTGGVCPYLVAIHANEAKPAASPGRRPKSKNWHAHVAWIDRNSETLRPHLNVSEFKGKGPTRSLRAWWEKVKNEHRARAGLEPVILARSPGERRPRVTQAGLNRAGERTAHALRCALDMIERIRAAASRRARKLIDIAKRLREQLREAIARAEHAERQLATARRALEEATQRELELGHAVSELRARDRERAKADEMARAIATIRSAGTKEQRDNDAHHNALQRAARSFGTDPTSRTR